MTQNAQQVARKSPIELVREEMRGENLRDALGRLAPKGVDGDRLLSLVEASLVRNPEMAAMWVNHDQRRSLLLAVAQSIQCGLEVDSPLGEAHLVAVYDRHTRMKQVSLWLGYPGTLKLVYRGGFISWAQTYVVHEGDLFKWVEGEKPQARAEPVPGAGGEGVGGVGVGQNEGRERAHSRHAEERH